MQKIKKSPSQGEGFRMGLKMKISFAQFTLFTLQAFNI